MSKHNGLYGTALVFFTVLRKSPSLTEREVEEAHAAVRQTQKDAEGPSKGCGKYDDYAAKERAHIGKYTAEHGPAKGVHHCSKLLGRQFPERTARRLWSEYLQELKKAVHEYADDCTPVIQSLPKGSGKAFAPWRRA